MKNGPGCASGHYTSSRYMTAPSSASSGGAVAMNDRDRHAGGIPTNKTRSSSPDHHLFQPFSYITTSHLPSLLDEKLLTLLEQTEIK